MIVIADTGPLNYLVLIGKADVLPQLYGRVFIPEAVCRELQHDHAPAPIRQWIAAPPDWLEIRAVTTTVNSALEYLGVGEREAIALAQQVGADLLILDDREAREEALRNRFVVIGTLRVLEDAANEGLLELAEALVRLRATNFRAPNWLLEEMLARWTKRRQT